MRIVVTGEQDLLVVLLIRKLVSSQEHKVLILIA